MAFLALNWASGDDEVLKQFDLLFYIKLSEVTGKDKTLEEIITEQHEELNGMDEQLKRQLQGSDGRVLLILDGLDEYAMGTNIVIDNIVNNRSNATMGKTCVLITSRSEAQNLNLIAKQMNKVILARGFDKENVIQCAKNFFRSVGNEKEVSSFLRDDILELLRVPIILVMAYLLHQEHTEQSLLTSKTEVIGEIINLILDRKKIRNLTEEEKNNIKIQVGKTAWAAAKQGTMLLHKVNTFLVKPASYDPGWWVFLNKKALCLSSGQFLGHMYLCANYFVKCATNSFHDLNAIKASANKNAIGVFAIQTPQHFTYFG